MTATHRPPVAVLGGGMLGVCTALGLARRGVRVTLFEGAEAPLQGASRWNEGKIHLGFLYAGDPSLATAAKVLPGGLAFVRLVERLVERPITGFATSEDDQYLVHRESVADPEAFAHYAAAVSALIRDAARAPGADRYFCDLRDVEPRRMTARELAEATSSPDVVAGFRVPERSVSTSRIADLLLDTLRAEPLVDVQCRRRVERVSREADDRLTVRTTDGAAETFGTVVNALWEGRPAIDATMGLQPPAPWTHRFRAAVFASVPETRLRSAVVCTGPFGDVKRVADGGIYLSWYGAGLLAEGSALEPPRERATLDDATRARVLRETIDGLSPYFPAVAELAGTLRPEDVHGGWVYAVGQGSLADRASTLHRRDRFDLHVDRGYVSVDTAKYSIAPWLAEQIVGAIVGEIA